MVKKSTQRRATNTASTKTIEIEKAELKQFCHTEEAHPGFSFTRYWYSSASERTGITPLVQKKLAPGDDPSFGMAARHEVLLPASAPSDFTDVSNLTRRFDETLPEFHHHAMVQVKLGMDHSKPWHAHYEDIRAYAKAHFATKFPVILIAHVPSIAALEGFGNHVHCIVLARKITRDGLGGISKELCSDKGYKSALAAWQEFHSQEVSL